MASLALFINGQGLGTLPAIHPLKGGEDMN